MNYHKENFNGTLDFRCKLQKNWCVEQHLHEYSEIIYCKNGNGVVLINGCDVPLKEREFVWIPPNRVHQLHFENAEVVCAVFSNDLIPLYFSLTNEKQPIVSPIQAEELSNVLEELYLLPGDRHLKISGILNLVADKVIEHSCFEEASRTDGILVQQVITYLSNNYTKKIKLSDLAKLFGYNEKYVSHTLHALTGTHFSRLLAFYRVEHAKKLLRRNPQKSVTTVALESGFSAINTFHRVFLRHTGMTPLQYKHLRNG